MRMFVVIISLMALCGCKKTSSEFEVNVLDYDSHSYVIFESEFGDIAVVHNPNCKCYADANF